MNWKMLKNILTEKSLFEFNWLGIRVFIPERLDVGIVSWHLTRAPPEKLTKTLKSWRKFMNANTATTRFTQAGSFQRHNISCSKGETFIGCPAKRVEVPETNSKEPFSPSTPLSLELLG